MKYFLIYGLFILLMIGVAQEGDWAQWKKHVDPVYESPDSGFAASDPSVLFEDGRYLLYYTDVDNRAGATIISLATSQDGLEWSYQKRLLELDKTKWDAAHESAAIWKENGKPYHLFYIGYQPKEYPPQGFYSADLGLAVSENAAGDFGVLPEPILERSRGWYDSDMIASPDIIKVRQIYYMIYTGHCYENCVEPAGVRLLGATSTDLIHWTKHDAPVLEADPDIPWMAGYVAEPALLEVKGKFYLFFTAFADWENTPPLIGLAQSETPFGPWDINPEPIVVATEDWENAWVGAPYVLLQGDTVEMWYMGVSKEGVYQIGYASSILPLHTK